MYVCMHVPLAMYWISPAGELRRNHLAISFFSLWFSSHSSSAICFLSFIFKEEFEEMCASYMDFFFFLVERNCRERKRRKEGVRCVIRKGLLKGVSGTDLFWIGGVGFCCR